MEFFWETGSEKKIPTNLQTSVRSRILLIWMSIGTFMYGVFGLEEKL